MTTIKTVSIGAVVWVVVCTCTSVMAQECLRVESVPPKVTVTLKGAEYRSLVAPGQYCSLVPGRTYRVTASLDRFESRGLKLRLPEDGGQVHFSGDRAGRVGRSVVIPGWGQGSMGYAANAFEAVLSVGGSGLKFWQSRDRYLTAKREYERHSWLADNATSENVRIREVAETNRFRNNAELYRDDSYVVAGILGWQMLANVAETYLLARPPGAEILEDGTVQLRIPERTGFRAAVRSLFFPGLGQKYNGDHGRAVLFQFGTMVCAMFAADYRLEYRLEESGYVSAMERFRTATDVVEKERALNESRAYAASRDERQRDMYVYVGGAGVLWLLSVIDAAANGGRGEEPGFFGMETSYRSGTARGGVVVRF